MKNLIAVALGLGLSWMGAACGTDVAPTPDGGTQVDPEGFAPLVTTAWSLPANTEKYLCVRVTVTEDMWIQAIRPVAPIGTHHTVLMLENDGALDGVTECTSSLSQPAIFGSGTNAARYDFPAGVGLHVVAGQQLFLNLHLFNASDNTLTGTSGVSFLAADPAAIQFDAGAVLAGKAAGLTVAPGASQQTGTCTTPAGLTIFSVAPHMHLLGTHMKVTYTVPGASPQTLLDTDYSFDNQQYHNITPITSVAGGKLAVTCSYVNTTGAIVGFGESTTDEMCFALTLLYPPQTQTTCVK